MMFLCFLLTRVGKVNDSVFFDSRQLDRLDDWLDLKPDKEVGKEAKDILPNRFVQVHDVLDGKVAHVEGEYVFAKSMQKLDVVKGIRHRRGIPQCQIAPGQIFRTI